MGTGCGGFAHLQSVSFGVVSTSFMPVSEWLQWFRVDSFGTVSKPICAASALSAAPARITAISPKRLLSKQTSSYSLDHLVGAGEEIWREDEVHCSRGA